MGEGFTHFARRASAVAGHYATFIVALAIVVGWAVTGPLFHFSDTWQLVINTGTTVITFLMVFLIQNTQNRDAQAVHLKLDELIRSIETADNELIRAEDETAAELVELKRRYTTLIKVHEALAARLPDDEGAAAAALTAATTAIGQTKQAGRRR